ncbi:hypothetical protein EC968_007016 [Mortierella alpina]|nr:hypothetical protein EC968_007016 [Mortierella alpina]
MLGLISTPSGSDAALLLKTALPIGIGLASAVFLTVKAFTRDSLSTDKSIPTASLRLGETSHDAEYEENPDVFVLRCEEQYGPVFNCYLRNRLYTVISEPLVREVFMTEDLSLAAATDELSGLHAQTMSITKSRRDFSDPAFHAIVRDNITPNLALFTPKIVECIQAVTERDLGRFSDRKLNKNPLLVFQDAITSAMAAVFMGDEAAKDRKVLHTFIHCTEDLARIVSPSSRNKRWHALLNKFKYGIVKPLKKHVQVLVDFATPIIQERRRQEAEASEKGIEYKRPLDIMQRILDNFDKYGVVDLEDVCGHLIVLVLGAVHSTSDGSTFLCYYLAAFPECIEPLYQEQVEVLDQICKEREEQRQRKLECGDVHSVDEFTDTELDPRNDRDLSSTAVKRMVKMDSFVREYLRFRSERVELAHMAKNDVVLSNGMTIHKGGKVLVNLRSVHQNPETQGDEPTEFQPWRFVGKGKVATKVSTDFLLFGMGKHACPGRFLAIQEIKTIGALMVSRYSKIEMQDSSQKMKALLSRVGDPVPTGLYFTSRNVKNSIS